MKYILTFCIFFIALTLIAQTQEEVEVKTIQVWVKADRNGKPVTGLTVNDFEIEEDGKKMASTCFEEVLLPLEASTESSEGQTQESSADQGPLTRKRLAIFFDQINTSEVEFQYMQSRLDEFLNQIDEKDLEMMLAVYPPYEPVVPFTKEVSEVREQLDKLSGNLHRDQEMMLKRKQIINILEKKPFKPQLIPLALDYAVQYQEEEIAQARSILEALKKFGSTIEELQQTEHTVVLLISGGLNIEPGRQYFDLVRAKTGDAEEGLPLGGMRGIGWDLRREVKELIGRMNVNNLTIYTINTRGPISTVDTTLEFDKKYYPKDNDYLRDHQEIMDIVADDTGGVSFRNSLNFKFGFAQVMKDLEHQYLICYKAPDHKKAGEYHKIKVKTKTKADLRHRAGYID